MGTSPQAKLPISVLLVDDDELLGRLYKRTLQSAGFAARYCSSGSAALELLARIPPPDLILLDSRMPEMTGEEFLQRLEEQIPLTFSRSKTVAFTLLPPGIGLTRKFETMVSEFVQKPDNVEAFVAVVRRLTNA